MKVWVRWLGARDVQQPRPRVDPRLRPHGSQNDQLAVVPGAQAVRVDPSEFAVLQTRLHQQSFQPGNHTGFLQLCKDFVGKNRFHINSVIDDQAEQEFVEFSVPLEHQVTPQLVAVHLHVERLPLILLCERPADDLLSYQDELATGIEKVRRRAEASELAVPVVASQDFVFATVQRVRVKLLLDAPVHGVMLTFGCDELVQLLNLRVWATCDRLGDQSHVL